MVKTLILISLIIAVVVAGSASIEDKGNRVIVIETPELMEVRVVTQEGKVIKTFPYEMSNLVVSPDSLWFIIGEEIKTVIEEDSGTAVRFSLIDAGLYEHWTKEFSTSHSWDIAGVGFPSPYFFKISGNSSRIFFVRNHDVTEVPKLEFWCDMMVFESNGDKIVHFDSLLQLNNGTHNDLDISPDGELALLRQNFRRQQSVYQVTTGKMKIFATGGEVEGYGWSAAISFPGNSKIRVVGRWQKTNKRVFNEMTFEELPDDLGELIARED